MTIYIKNLSLLSLFAIAITLNFTSCKDDNFIITETDIEVIYPDTASYLLTTGKVVNNDGDYLTNITVEYFMDGELMSINTDENGDYAIRDTDLSTERKKIMFHGEGYLPKMDILFKPDNNVIEKNIILAREDDFTNGPGANLSMQNLTDSLIAVSGRLINDDGVGVSGLSVIIVEISNLTFYYGITDEDGYWSIAMEPTENALLGVYSDCEGFEGLIGELELLEDEELGDLATSFVKPEVVNFNGFITDCNTGEGLVLGSIQFSFAGDVDIETADIINGAYEVAIAKCIAADCIDVTIYSYQNTSGVDEFDCQSYTTGENEFDFEVCNSSTPNPPTGGIINHTIDGETVEYTYGLVEEDLGRYTITAYNESENTGLVFETPDLSNEGTFTTGAVLDLITFTVIYSAGFDRIDYQIDSITTEFMYGKYNGEMIEGISGPWLPVEGDFKAKIQ